MLCLRGLMGRQFQQLHDEPTSGRTNKYFGVRLSGKQSIHFNIKRVRHLT